MNEFKYVLLLQVVCNVFLLFALKAQLNQHATTSADVFKHCLSI